MASNRGTCPTFPWLPAHSLSFRSCTFDRAITLAAMVSSCGLIAGCTISGSENFVRRMQSDVGRSADDPFVIRNRDRPQRTDVKTLTNGNTEEEFSYGPRCRVYFEIDATSRTITKWRFDPSRQDCRMPF